MRKNNIFICIVLVLSLALCMSVLLIGCSDKKGDEDVSEVDIWADVDMTSKEAVVGKMKDIVDNTNYTYDMTFEIGESRSSVHAKVFSANFEIITDMEMGVLTQYKHEVYISMGDGTGNFTAYKNVNKDTPSWTSEIIDKGAGFEQQFKFLDEARAILALLDDATYEYNAEDNSAVFTYRDGKVEFYKFNATGYTFDSKDNDVVSKGKISNAYNTEITKPSGEIKDITVK